MAAWLNINDYLVNYEKTARENLEIRIAKHKEQTASYYLAYVLLNGAGFPTGPIEAWRLSYGSVFHVEDLKDFQKIHKALGNLKEYTREAAPGEDGRTRKVVVTMQPKDEQFAFLRFTFIKQLPKPDKRKGVAGQPKCRLVTRTRKETVLVCEKD